MAASSSLRNRISDIATCPICLDDFRDPRLLPCVHSFCFHCLQGQTKDKHPGDEVPCPLCRSKFQIPADGLKGLPRNFVLRNLVDAKRASHEGEIPSHTEASQVLKSTEIMRQNYLQSSPQVIHTFARADEVCGMTLLNNELYVLRRRDTDQVDVYSTTDFTLLRRLSVNGLSSGMTDVASCAQKQCVYIADWDRTCIHRVGLDQSATKWPLRIKPLGVSVTPGCHLLVTCHQNGKLVELSGKDGRLLREIQLQADVKCPEHGIQLMNNQYVVCHEGGVSLVESDGRTTRSTSEDIGLKTPYHIAVDGSRFTFAADFFGARVVLFSPSLNSVRNVLQHMSSWPLRLCFDDATRRLYVGHYDASISVVQM